ncbi:MAG: AhpC/TSA family protein [Bacteroidales bacterium]|nr:AhpC/TSA family protein [Bacteroidales bacterium]
MKKIHILLLLFSMIFFYSCSEKKNIKISGQITGGARKVLYLDYLKVNKTDPIDSVKISRDGSFSFSFHSPHPGIYLLRSESGKLINLLPHPGENLTITADYEEFSRNYTVAGSEESEYLRQLVSKIQDTRDKLTQLDNIYGSLPNVTEEQASEYITKRKNIIKDQRDYSIRFIIEHLNSLASIYALYQEIDKGQYVLSENRDIQYMKIVADSVSKAYPDVALVQSFVNDARKAEQRFYNLKSLSEKMGIAEVGIPEIALPDPEGDTIKLSSLRGKTVLLYFWSTISKEGSALNPALKDIYNKNKSAGFEIYAVAIERSKEAWKRVLRFDELNWINVSELTYPESEAAAFYNVKVIPSTFLINKEGDIVARDIHGPELQKWLDNMLK